MEISDKPGKEEAEPAFKVLISAIIIFLIVICVINETKYFVVAYCLCWYRVRETCFQFILALLTEKG